VSNRQFGLALGGYFLVLLALAAWLPLADDEFYYWCWSRSLQPSYFDHPPMCAYFVWASTAVFGDSPLAIRLPACLSSIVVLGVVGHLCRPRAFAAWVAFTPVFLPGAVLLTPDTPLLLFWSLYLLWVTKTLQTLDDPAGRISAAWWLLGGIVLGCGALSKYTSVLAVPAGFLAFAGSAGGWRKWCVGYVAHGTVAGSLALPVLYFNFQHDFEPLGFQWNHANADGVNPFTTFGEFVGVQLLLAGLLPFVVLVWTLSNARAVKADPILRTAACLFVVPFALFLFKATRGPLEGNWALAAYLGCWPLAARWAAVRPAWWTAAAFAFPVLASAFLIIHAFVPVPIYPAKHDRLTRQSVRIEAGRTASESIRNYPEPLPVYTATYQWVAIFRYQGVPVRQLPSVSRPSHFTQEPNDLGRVDRMLVWNEGPLPPEWIPGFELPELIETFPITVRGETVTYFHLLLYQRPSTVTLPCERVGSVP